uniref:Glycosyltransferase family 1 protein n=1 Tax=Ignavibacterium album TaxID=591197 RepID=A0A832G7B7_9BACT
MKIKLIRITTRAVSMNIILRGQLKFMNNFFEVIGITSYDEKHFAEISLREGIKTLAVDLSRDINIFKDFAALINLVSIFRREKPTIVHTHTPKAGLLGMLAARLLDVPIRLHTVGGMPLVEAKGMKRTLLNFTEKITYKCSHSVYPNSFGLRNIILQNKLCPASKLKVIANGGTNGIDADYFSVKSFSDPEVERKKLRESLSIKEDEIAFLFVGRIAVEKGVYELVDVFEDLSNKYKIKLIFIGTFEKEYGSLNEEYIEKILKNDRILFLGRFDDVRPYYLLSDIFVLPSYREGLPGAVLEAGAMELPCIVTDINGCNEIVQDGFNGLLIKPKDRESLKQAMQKLIVDQSLRNKLADNARNAVISKYDRNIIWQALLEEYHSHLKRANIKYEIK